jgi:hypothetical protein
LIVRRAIAALLLIITLASSASALDVRVKEVRRGSSAVATTIELRDVLPDRFKKTLDSGGVLHLRLQAELWESRPVWDRLVYPALVRVLRFHRTQPSGEMSITDAAGSATTYAVVAGSMPVALELGEASRITPAERYYVHVIATLGTLADREVDEVGDALFGRPSEANGLGSLGRLVFRTALQVSDYLQSVSAEARSRRTAGADILKP